MTGSTRIPQFCAILHTLVESPPWESICLLEPLFETHVSHYFKSLRGQNDWINPIIDGASVCW